MGTEAFGFSRWAIARAFLVGAAAVGFLVPGLQARGADGDRLDITYYKLAGLTRAELIASIRRNGPRNGFAYGVGIIEFFPRYSLERRDGSCRIANVETSLTVDLRVPQWDGTKGASRAVARQATRFAQAVKAHEMQHVVLARAFQRRFDARLEKLAPDNSCWALRRAAEALIMKIKKEHVAAQRAFDDRTRPYVRKLI